MTYRTSVPRFALLLLFACAQKSPPPPPGKPIVDVALAATCTISFDCGQSHPGLGTSANTRAADLATCTRTTSSFAGPYDGGSPATGTPKPPPVATKIPADQCRDLAALLATITDLDVAAAQESAQMDSIACGLRVVCGGVDKLRVQRQTTSGSTRIEQLIRAL